MPAINPASLRAAREAAGLSRELTSIRLGKSFHTLVAYESGQAVPPGNVLVAMASLYGVQVEALCAEAPAGAQ